MFIEVWIRSWQTRSESIGELMKKIRQSFAWALVLVSLAFLLQPIGARAQDAQSAPDAQPSQNSQSQNSQNDAQNADQQDPPTRVARLNYMEGSVSFQPGGENDWVTAELNRPLVTGDNLWADENSRAELHIGSTALRLGPKTGITLLEVSDQAAQIRLVQGSLIVNVRHVDDENAYEIDTPNVAFVVTQPGDYRMDVDPDGNRTDVTVWRGRGEATGGGNTYSMGANQYAKFTGNGNDQLDYSAGDVPNQDGLDSWAQDRDQNEDRSDAANYVSRDMTGYEDLDQYGDWSYIADYGMVWRPTALVPGWAPYRYGNWTWVAPWGWTWVENEPWGFAPFHYGRWAFSADRLGVGSGTEHGAPGLRARAGQLGWRRSRISFLGRRGSGVVPARSRRSIHSGLSRESWVRKQRERYQHGSERHQSHQRLQRSRREPGLQQGHLCEPQCERRRDGSFTRYVCKWPLSSAKCDAGSAGRACAGARLERACGRAGSEQHLWYGQAGGKQAASGGDESPGRGAAYAGSIAEDHRISIGRTKLDCAVAGAPATARGSRAGDAPDAITDTNWLPYGCTDRGGRQPGKTTASRVGGTRYCGARAADEPAESRESKRAIACIALGWARRVGTNTAVVAPLGAVGRTRPRDKQRTAAKTCVACAATAADFASASPKAGERASAKERTLTRTGRVRSDRFACGATCQGFEVKVTRSR